MSRQSYAVVIPTLNAGGQLVPLIERLRVQRLAPTEILVVDSASTDGTVEAVRAMPDVRLIEIERAAFDHGGTRDMALRQCESEFVVFMTQDALPVDDTCMEKLLSAFEHADVAAVGARQTAYPDARPFERLIRANNYPAENREWGEADIPALGVQAFLISDVCAAYRKSAYLAVGGFDHPTLTNEDMLMAQKLLEAGWRVAYSGDAVVYHSHNFTLRQEYLRNYVIGQTMKRYEARFAYASEMKKGTALVKNVLLGLLKQGHVGECFCFCMDCAARLLGNRMGRWKESRKTNA